jgi:penicillin-binding protein 2
VEPGKKDCYRDAHDNSAAHAWFVAYAPFENPQIAVVVFVYDGNEGSATAVPVAKTIMEAYFSQISPPAQ